MQDEDLIVIEESKALRTLKRVGIVWPLLALPFVPAAGKAIAGLIVAMALQHGVMQ